MVTVNPRTGLLITAMTLAVALPILLLPGCGKAVGQEEEADAEALPEFKLSQWTFSEKAQKGRKVYDAWCVGCHGQDADGAGDAAPFLNPLPRNFQKGLFKFRSTASSQLPTRDDLMHVITCGLNGSSMPAFPLVSQEDREAVVEYVLEVALFGKAREEIYYLVDSEERDMNEVVKNDLPAIKKRVYEQYEKNAKPLPVPPYPAPTAASVQAGKERYARECANCHGLTGRGDGGSAYTMRDWKNSTLLPRDFVTGIYRAGSTPQEIYKRLKTGANGTPMPAISGTDADLWSLVHYLLSIKDPNTPQPKFGCDAETAK